MEQARRRERLLSYGKAKERPSEKGAVREDEERERGAPARREERRTEASGRLNNIIGGVLTVPGRPRANSSPLSPYGPSASSYSLLPLSLTASYSPARTLRPRRALVEGPTEWVRVSPVGRRESERATPRAKEDAQRVRGHLALADRHHGRFLLFFPPRSSSFFFFFSDSFLRRGGPRTFFLARARARARAPSFTFLS